MQNYTRTVGYIPQNGTISTEHPGIKHGTEEKARELIEGLKTSLTTNKRPV